MKPSPALMWGTATLMVTIVSCCSLVGVSIMPLISGPFYKSSITLFTGLAVGSLLGSAIFSLIPQAFSLHLQPDKAYLWKSLVIFLGVYLFYCSERLMKIYFERKERQQSKRYKDEQVQLKRSKSNNIMTDISARDSLDGNGDDNDVSRDVLNDGVVGTGHSNSDKMRGQSTTNNDIGLVQNRHHEGGDNSENTQSIPHQQGHNMSNQNEHNHNHHHHHHSAIQPHEVIRKALKGDKITTSVPRKPDRVAPVAWMIIIGDGLHNFIDGLSIGAAFSESIYQGMIICVAVIFEELPHELGDFAVLISSGMTVKQALGFNFLSACTCYIGMVVGIVLGDMAQSASFIFALAAGMFFYISLVDMMGELSAALDECKDDIKESTHLLIMQNIGILSGIVIIFSLSLFGPGG